MKTICPLLRRWRELRKIATESPSEDPPVTDSVMETAKEMISRLRQVLKVEAKHEIDAASAVNAGKLSSAEAERDAAIAPSQAFAIRCRFDGDHVIEHVRRATGNIDEDSVEPRTKVGKRRVLARRGWAGGMSAFSPSC